MNAPATVHPIRPGAAWLTPAILESARECAKWHEDQGRSGTAVTIFNLVAEIEALREAAKGSLVIVNQAQSDKNTALLKASIARIALQRIAAGTTDDSPPFCVMDRMIQIAQEALTRVKP